MKRIVSLLLVILLITTSFSFASSSEQKKETVSHSEKMLKEIKFDTNVNSFALNETQKQSNNKKQLQIATAEIKKMNLESQGLGDFEKQLIQTIDDYSKNNITVFNIKIYETLQDSTALQTFGATTYYGTYRGFNFRQIYATCEVGYETVLTSTNADKLRSWVTLGTNLSLCFAPYAFTVPYTILSSASQSKYSQFTVSKATFVTGNEITDRYLYIQDLQSKSGMGPDYYVPVYQTKRMVVSTYLNTIFASPYQAPISDCISYSKAMSSPNYYSNSATLFPLGYDRYMYYNAAPIVERIAFLTVSLY